MRFQTGRETSAATNFPAPRRSKRAAATSKSKKRGAPATLTSARARRHHHKRHRWGFRAEAGSGDIHGKGSPKNVWSVRTGSGNVTLHVPSDTTSTSTSSSHSGTVTLGHPVTTTVQGRIHESRKSVMGRSTRRSCHDFRAHGFRRRPSGVETGADVSYWGTCALPVLPGGDAHLSTNRLP